jgi:hypothetical protein
MRPERNRTCVEEPRSTWRPCVLGDTLCRLSGSARFDLRPRHRAHKQSVGGCVQCCADIPVARFRYAARIVVVTRLVSSRRQPKMRASSVRSFEARRIVHSGFESQGCNRTNTHCPAAHACMCERGNRHHPHAPHLGWRRV